MCDNALWEIAVTCYGAGLVKVEGALGACSVFSLYQRLYLMRIGHVSCTIFYTETIRSNNCKPVMVAGVWVSQLPRERERENTQAAARSEAQ